ncbi:hypothetical protein [Embleya sp. AB8]|uniref:hypothetical protein n=1 Tax=Embleya sp. AB8 TaxID=3156304 RepID=UPI003C78BF65
MDTIAELDRRFHAFDPWLPPGVVSALVECDHLDELRFQARGGDWCCAREWASLLAARGEWDAALGVLAPFADTGWWEAVRTVAEHLVGWGRGAEAIALVRPAAERGEGFAIERLAVLLAGEDRIDDVIALLAPHTADMSRARELVDLTAGRGRDDKVLGLLPAVPAEPPFGEFPGVVGLPAEVLERQGRVDEALALLATRVHHPNGSVNVVEQYADTLARHGREAQLRDFADGAGGARGARAASRLAILLEEQGRVDDAVDALRPFVATGDPNPALETAEILFRHDRVDEAVELLRPESGLAYYEAWVLQSLFIRLVERGRAQEALAIVDGLAAVGDMSVELFALHVWLLSELGLAERAIAEVRARPDADTSNMRGHLVNLLTLTGRLDEAVEILTPSRSEWDVETLASLLVRVGRVKEAVATWHERVITPIAKNSWAAW